MNNKKLIEKTTENPSNKNDNENTKKYQRNNSPTQVTNNFLIPISINRNIKSAFKVAIEKHGIDIMNPEDFIELVYTYLSEENKTEQMEGYRCRIEIFVKTFIFFLVHWKFSLLEQTFDIKENFIKSLLKKQLFKCHYLKHHTVEGYKKKDHLQEKNYFIIYNVIKLIEYKYDINIVGISSYREQNKSSVYSLEQKFNWYIKFVDYIIICYLSNNRITPFSQFLNSLTLKKEIEKFDKERAFDLNHFFSQMKEETFIKQIIYIVENVIYHLINKK